MPYLYNHSEICEICGKHIEWNISGSEFDEVEIHHDFGERWGGDHNSESFCPCICGTCFREKIYPFLKWLGVKSEYVGTSDAVSSE